MRLLNSLKIKNTFSERIKVILEPWCWEYYIEPGSTLEIVPERDCEHDIEIRYDIDKDITVWGWSRLMKVLSDGESVEPQFE